MPFAGNLRTLPLPDVLQTLNNIKANGVLRLRCNAGSRDVVFHQGEIVGVGFLDKAGREELDLRLSLLGVEDGSFDRLKGVTWYWTAMQARGAANRAELDELVHEQARGQLYNLFAWAAADFAFDETGPGKTVANALLGRSLERPLSIDTATILLEAARHQDEWADLRARIREETGAAAMGSSPALALVDPQATADGFEPPAEPEDASYHLYLDGEWRGPYPRQQIIGLVQTGEVPPETWSYDPLTQERRTLDQLLGGEARRITLEELESLRQAVKAAEGRLAEERAGRSADLAELRGLASEVLRLAHDCQLSDPAISVVVERLAEVVGGEDPSIVALAAETVVVALVRQLRDLGERELDAARARAEQLAVRIAEAEGVRAGLEAQLAEAERRSDADRETAAGLRQRLAAAAEDATRLDQELERARRDPSRVSTARVDASRPSEAIAAADAEQELAGRPAELEREIGRMRAERARLHNEVAVLQARFDEDRARHEAELEASRALASSLRQQRQDPPTETIGKATERHPAAESALAAERRAKLAEEELATVRTALERAEQQRREQERTAYEAARQHTQAQIRLRELVARFDMGEGRPGESDDLAGQLVAAREHAAGLAAEAVRLRGELAAMSEATTGKLERAKRRISVLRARLREATRDRQVQVPWSSPATATFAAAPSQPQAQVPWPSPATASYAPGQPAAWQPPAPHPLGAALSPHGAPEPPPEANLRTTSGSFVPMPMPDDSSAQRQRVQLPSVVLQRPAPRAGRLPGIWVAAAAGLLLALGLWWGARSAVPVCERAQVNGEEVAVHAAIAGRLSGVQVREGSWVKEGQLLATLRNTEQDRFKLDRLGADRLSLDSRVLAIEGLLLRIRAEHDAILAEQALPGEAGDQPATSDPRLRLRDEFAARILDLQSQLDEWRARVADNARDVASEERRLADEREKPVFATVAGVVLQVGEDGDPIAQGQPVAVIMDSSTLVIDAEIPAAAGIDTGMQATVKIGRLVVAATVQDQGEVRTGRLARSPTITAGYRRVLLKPENRAALVDVYSQQARIAFTGEQVNVFGSFGLWLRGF
jgi:multidrug resistance efflux pump